MSITAEQRLEIEAAQREQIRRTRLAEACLTTQRHLLAALGAVSASLRPRLAAEAAAVEAALHQATRQRLSDPDATRDHLARLETRWSEAVGEAERAEAEWTAQRAACAAQIHGARLRVEAAAEAVGAPGAAQVAEARVALTRATEAAERAEPEATAAAVHAIDAHLAAAHAAAQAEAERRTLVRALVQTLMGQGFTVAAPRLLTQGADAAGVVALEGRLPSGAQARFEVDVDGQVRFDLEGYVGAACKDDFDRIGATLTERFGVKLGPPQFTWKNPDKIKKGSRDVPGGGATRRGGRP